MAQRKPGAGTADRRLPFFALWSRWVLVGCFAAGWCIGTALAATQPPIPFEMIAYSSLPNGQGRAAAQFLPAGNTPTTTNVGQDMTVSWARTTATGGTAASGYIVKRYSTGGTLQATLANCSGIVTTLSCTAIDVPVGTWQYTVTPVLGSWTGTASLKSAPQSTSLATLDIPSSTISSLPATLNGTISGFEPGSALTFHLDSETGPTLTGTPTTVPAGGSGSITVTIPAGTDNLPHSVFAVDGGGTDAGQAITILDPPVLSTLQMFDTDSNGRIDQVKATFSKTLETYMAGTTPWTLSNVPSGGTLSSVSVSGAVATLTLDEGAGAADTTVGSFTVSLAANAAGIRDSAGQTGSFTATAPADKAAPAVLTRTMLDTNVNGKVDSVSMTFSENLASYTAGMTPWTLANVPSSGSLASVATATNTATLTITEGSGAADTAVGSFTVALATNASGVRDAAGNQTSWAATAPADGAKPIRQTMAMNDVNANGKVDQVLMTFSESLSSYGAGAPGVTLTSVPSTGTFSSFVTSGSTATLTLTEGSGATSTAVGSFTVAVAALSNGITDPAGNMASFTATAPTDNAKPIARTITMTDSNSNGKVGGSTTLGGVTVVFSETLATYSLGTTSWTLANIPSAGTFANVTVATTTATVVITEGAGAADTSVGSFTVALAANAAGIRDAAGNLASFAAQAPLDGAKPIKITMLMQDVNANGKVDQVTANFSEPLAAYTAGNTGWTLTAAPSGGTLNSVGVSGAAATLTLNEGAGAVTTALGSFKVALATNAAGVRDAAGNLSSISSVAPTDRAVPILLSMTMTDSNANGKVDRVISTWSEALSTTSNITPWTLANTPSAGTKVSVSRGGTGFTNVITLVLTEGAGAADTTVGSFTVTLATNVTGVKDAANNLSSFAATAPVDAAAPARVTSQMFDTNGNGRIDQVVQTYSETIASYTAGTAPWTLANVPSGGSLASVSASGTTSTLTLNEGAGAANTAVGTFTVAMASNAGGIRDNTGNLSSFAAAAPTDKAAPVLVSATMLDNNANGKIDRVSAVFSETLSSYTAGITPWTLANVPSAGTLASVSVSTTTATLTITEGAGAADTSVGSFTVALATSATGIRDAGANLASFAAQTPSDGAGPVAVSMGSANAGATAGLLEAGDTFTVTFSEPLDPASVPGTVTVTETDPSGAGNDTLTITGITNGARNTGSDLYVSGDGGNADYASSTTALSNGNRTVVVTVVDPCTGTECGTLGAGVAAALAYAPATTLTDVTGNAAAGTLTTSLRLF